MIGTDTQALDHPLGTAIGPHGPGWPNGLLPQVNLEYEQLTGRKVIEDFPELEPCHQAVLKRGICGIENVGGEIMGMGHELGLIKSGYLADVLLVDGDPVKDIKLFQNRNNLLAVMKDGHFHKHPQR